MSNFQNSFFQFLPKEILLKILASIDTLALVNFCKVYKECSYAYTTKSVVRTLTFYKVYSLTETDLESMSKKLLIKHVVVLNLNCVYWVAPSILRKFICEMEELEELYAIDTELSLTLEDIQTYEKLSKLKKLAVTVQEDSVIAQGKKLPNIKVLYIDFVPQSEEKLPLKTIFPGLEYIWWNSEYMSSLNLATYPKFFTKITATGSEVLSSQQPLLYSSGMTFYSATTMYYYIESCCEMYTPHMKYRHIGELFSNDVPNGQLWRTLYRMAHQVPFGPRDAIKLRWNGVTMQTHFFEDLKLHSLRAQCDEACKHAFREVLKLPTCRRLKGLAVMTCLIYCTVEDDSSANIPCKRRRHEMRPNNISDVFDEIVENISNLETLEILHCRKETHSNEIEIFDFIAKFKHLKYLSLQIPDFVTGEFLEEVLKSCKSLEVLKIECLTENENLNYHLSRALPEATALKDFRYKCLILDTDLILEGLALIPKLERIALICQTFTMSSLVPLDKVMLKNDQLIFFYIGVEEARSTLIITICHIFDLYNERHPARNFIIKNTKGIPRRGSPIPDVHFKEMILSNSIVARLRDYEDILTF